MTSQTAISSGSLDQKPKIEPFYTTLDGGPARKPTVTSALNTELTSNYELPAALSIGPTSNHEHRPEALTQGAPSERCSQPTRLPRNSASNAALSAQDHSTPKASTEIRLKQLDRQLTELDSRILLDRSLSPLSRLKGILLNRKKARAGHLTAEDRRSIGLHSASSVSPGQLVYPEHGAHIMQQPPKMSKEPKKLDSHRPSRSTAGEEIRKAATPELRAHSWDRRLLSAPEFWIGLSVIYMYTIPPLKLL